MDPFHSLLLMAADLSNRLLQEIACPALLTALIYLLYRTHPAFSGKLIRSYHASCRRVSLYVLAAVLGPLLLRLALLPWAPHPEPRIHDDFVHLLVADTLIEARLANPPHPLWHHLETIYVLQQPTYSSIYPIGQGIILATGKLLTGNPWAGVLLATGLMCGAISWMLFGWLPPSWAAIGGLLASFGLAARWENTYSGGAFCAFGGALLFGALGRLRESASKFMGLIAGLGWSIAWLTRPFESVLLFVFAWAFIVTFMIRKPRMWPVWLGPIVLLLAVQFSAGCVTAFHDRAVTGSMTTMPYHLSQQVYGVPQSFSWQRAIEEPPFRHKELRDMYWCQRKEKDHATEHPLRHYGSVLFVAWSFFITPWYSVPIAVMALLLFRDREIFVYAGMMVFVLTASMLYPYFLPHYIAAYSCVIFFLIVRGLMMLSQWSFHGKAVGGLLAIFMILGGMQGPLRIVPIGSILGLSYTARQVGVREQVSERLMALGGQHVVFVRYAANHSCYGDELVYNGADVDRSRIVWCRTMGPSDDIEVMRYYKNRHAWVVDVDGDVARISSYQQGLQPDL